MLSLTLILTGCATTPQHLQTAAAEQQGRAAAGVAIERQPEECRKGWPLLSRADLVGHEALTGIRRYEDYITGTINPAKLRCWQFNEDIRTGLAARPAN